ncbi:MAG: DUF1304 domain-containing protein [Deltaproteobacteria bacterium]|nr:MAG: DUF1304 domain-containing protein [Deltaproteobacteria bacterium]
MVLASQLLTALVAALHVYFLVLEMFLWTSPTGQRAFGRTAAEQLVWSLIGSDPIALPVRTFFLGCIVVAGIYGGLTAVRRILYVQALPAAVALALTLALR